MTGKQILRFSLIALLLVIVGAVLVDVTRYSHFHDTTRSGRNACIANLKQLDAATGQWALEKKKETNDVPVLEEVIKLLHGSQLPACPLGGTYKLGKTVADSPTCTVPGHTL